MLRRRWATVAAVALVVVPCATAALEYRTRATATLELHAPLRFVSVRAAACPPGVGPNILCPARTGSGAVRGLGTVSETYSYMAAEAPADCPTGSSRILGYPILWVVKGKGELSLATAPNPTCLGPESGPFAPQAFTITGGSGAYVGASGSGSIARTGVRTVSGAEGIEIYSGTLTVPGLEFDLTPPVFSGARGKTVRAPRRATRVRVTFTVTAHDAVDGRMSAKCTPGSGSRFKIGRTVVSCTATDQSANRATARFSVNVLGRK